MKSVRQSVIVCAVFVISGATLWLLRYENPGAPSSPPAREADSTNAPAIDVEPTVSSDDSPSPPLLASLPGNHADGPDGEVSIESLTQALERLGLLEAVRPVMDLCAMVWELPFEGVETLNVGGRSRLVIRGGHGSSLSFDSDTRRLIGCFAGGFWRERPFSVDGTLIPHAEAAEKAQKFVHALGFTDDLPEMPYAIHGDGNNKPPWGVEYEFTRNRVHGAFRTGSRIFVEVSGHTGLVTAFDDFPLQIPESTEVLLSPEEAMSIARDVCVAHGLDAEVDSDCPPELWIFPSRLPQNCWTTDDPELYSDRDWTRPRACYRVGLHDQAICRHQGGSASRPLMVGYVVFVDCGTGEVVDGFRF